MSSEHPIERRLLKIIRHFRHGRCMKTKYNRNLSTLHLFPDCEKSLENVPTNVYESVCGSEISEFLGNQRTTPNSQSYTTNNKPFSSITNGKYSIEISLNELTLWYAYTMSVFRPQRIHSGQIDQMEGSNMPFNPYMWFIPISSGINAKHKMNSDMFNVRIIGGVLPVQQTIQSKRRYAQYRTKYTYMR